MPLLSERSRFAPWRRVTLGVGLFLSGSLLGAWGWQHFEVPHDPQLDTVINAWHTAQAVYVRPIDEDRLRDGALAGMASSLDPHSEWWSPKDQAAIRGELSGQYGGVGIRFRWTDQGAMLVGVKDGGPAAKAGLKKGDMVIAVNGHPITRETDAVSAWRGKPGSKVVMTIEDPTVAGPLKRRDVSMIREIIEGFGVEDESHTFNDQGDPWIRIRVQEFQESTVDEVARALRHQWIADQKFGREPAGLVLDLRGSPGGLVQTSVGLASLLMDPSQTVVILRERSGMEVMKTIDFPSEPWSSWAKKAPIVIWTDHGTASAAEIMVAALKDHGRAAWVIGETTFGKGSVQTAIPLIKGGDFKITTGLYTSPKGAYLQGQGETPDVMLVPTHPQDPAHWPIERNMRGALTLPSNMPVPLNHPRVTLTLPDDAWTDAEVSDTWFWKATALALSQAPSAVQWSGSSFPPLQ